MDLRHDPTPNRTASPAVARAEESIPPPPSSSGDVTEVAGSVKLPATPAPAPLAPSAVAPPPVTPPPGAAAAGGGGAKAQLHDDNDHANGNNYNNNNALSTSWPPRFGDGNTEPGGHLQCCCSGVRISYCKLSQVGAWSQKHCIIFVQTMYMYITVCSVYSHTTCTSCRSNAAADMYCTVYKYRIQRFLGVFLRPVGTKKGN